MRWTILLAAIALAGCGAREIEPSAYVQLAPAPVRVIAVDPAGGQAGLAVGAALAARGFTVIESPGVSAAPGRTLPVAPGSVLRAEGIDALLSVGGDRPQMPETLRATVRHAGRGTVLASVVWKTRFADQIGGALDWATGRTREDVAEKIADALVAQLNR
ncbi:MAG: hypothetical protein ACK4WC_01975 [Rubrimonas sp.]